MTAGELVVFKYKDVWRTGVFRAFPAAFYWAFEDGECGITSVAHCEEYYTLPYNSERNES